MRCIGPKAKDADLWILTWEELHRVHQEGILAEVKLVKAHRSKTQTQQMSLFEVSLLKEGMRRRRRAGKRGCWTEEIWRRLELAQSSRKEKGCTQRCNMWPAFIVWWRTGKTVKNSNKSQKKCGLVCKNLEAKAHRTEWCAAANTYRCMRCGRRSSKMMTIAWTCGVQDGWGRIPNLN